MCDSRDVGNAHKSVPRHLLPNQCSLMSDTNSERIFFTSSTMKISLIQNIEQSKSQIFKVIHYSMGNSLQHENTAVFNSNGMLLVSL